MKTKRFASVACIAMMTAGTAGAQSLSFGVGLTSDYISRGATNTNHRPAIQPWVEYENSGFYVGAWASNVDFGTNDSIELDLYGGYRWSVGNTGFDVGYARYLYNGVTGNCCGELYFLLNHDLSDTGASLFAGVHADIDTGFALTNIHGGISIPLMDRLSGSGRMGVLAGGSAYGDLGVTYTLNDSATVDLRLHDGGTITPRLVLSTAFSF